MLNNIKVISAGLISQDTDNEICVSGSALHEDKEWFITAHIKRNSGQKWQLDYALCSYLLFFPDGKHYGDYTIHTGRGDKIADATANAVVNYWNEKEKK
jgi:hypothetical protein